jgi:hypothetical protein
MLSSNAVREDGLVINEPNRVQSTFRAMANSGSAMNRAAANAGG